MLVVLSSVLFHGNPDLDVTWTGKIRSALLFVGLPVLLFSAVHTVDENAPWVRVVALVFVYLGTVGHVLAGAQYAIAMFAKGTGTATANARIDVDLGGGLTATGTATVTTGSTQPRAVPSLTAGTQPSALAN
ncbi:hypothetical protein IAE22_30520, partial [Bacillus sp. S34]|nr:hypothetical protein [Bacillus sp. S34]